MAKNSKLIPVFVVGAFLSVVVFIGVKVVYGQNFAVSTELPDIKNAGEISNVDGTNDSMYNTIRARCENENVADEQYRSVCCTPPDYWLNPACPYQATRQNLPFKPPQFGTAEEQNAYQAMYDCLGSTENKAACFDNSTLAGIENDLEKKKAACEENNKKCENTPPVCTTVCSPAPSAQTGPYSSSDQNKVYRILTDCYKQYGIIVPSCFQSVYKIPGTRNGNRTSDLLNQIMYRAYQDWKNGTIWSAPSGGKTCREVCTKSTPNCASEKSCADFTYLEAKAIRASNQAYDDWKASNGSNNERKPQPIPKPKLDHDFTEEFVSLAGGLARPFDELTLQARKFTAKAATDAGRNAVPAKELQEDWRKAAPIARTGLQSKNLEKGELVSAEMPEGLPVKKILFVTAGPVSYADTEITIFDGKTTPQLLRKEDRGAISAEDERVWPSENKDIEVPNSKKYDVSYYLRVGTVKEQGEPIHPFAGAMFEFLPSLPYESPEIYQRLRMQRWENSQKQWDNLPVEKSTCDKNGCRFIAKSPGTSYFAVVVEKTAEEKKEDLGFFKFLDLLLLTFISYVILREGKSAILPLDPKHRVWKTILRLLVLVPLSFIVIVGELILLDTAYYGISGAYIGAGSKNFMAAFFLALLNLALYQVLKLRGSNVVFRNPERKWLSDSLILLIGAALLLFFLLFS